MNSGPFRHQPPGRKRMEQTIEYLKAKKKILFLTTSNRWIGEKMDIPKSTRIAYRIADLVGKDKVEVIDVTALKIYPCEGNVSSGKGNTCGEKASALKDPEKNPSGCHRCWASFNNPDDELWRISKVLLQADAVVFFGSVRWGQMNAFYQKLIERLTWLENRQSTFKEENLLMNIDAGLIAIGHNWHGADVLETQKSVYRYFGFRVPEELSWNWWYTNPEDESNQSYLDAINAFEHEFLK